MRQARPHQARRDDADESGNEERVVDDVLPYVRRARPVEADGGEVRGVGGQDEVSVGRPVEADERDRVHPELQAEGGDHQQRRGLGVHQLAHDEQDDGVGPRVVAHDAGEGALERLDVGAHEGLRHPGHAEH